MFYDNLRIAKKSARRTIGGRTDQTQTLTFTKAGSITTQTEQFAVSAAMLGYSFRVVRVTTFARVASTGGTITVAVKSGAASISTTEAIIADGATGAARYAEATLNRVLLTQMFLSTQNSLLSIDVTVSAGAGAADLTVAVVIEKTQSPMFAK